MFPYTIPNLVVAWTFSFFLLQDIYLFHTLFETAILKDVIFLTVFIFMAKRYYKKTPQTIGASAFIIAYNLAVVPLLIVNVLTTPYLVKSIGSGGMIYLAPILYSPIIFAVSFALIYLVKKIANKKSDNASEPCNNPKADT